MEERVNSQVQVARFLPCNGLTCNDYVAHLPSTRVERAAMQTSRQRKDFAQILLLVMWILTLSVAVGVHKHTSPFTHAISRTDISKHKKLMESRCAIFRKERMRVERFWLRVYPFTELKGARAGVMNVVLQKLSTWKE